MKYLKKMFLAVFCLTAGLSLAFAQSDSVLDDQIIANVITNPQFLTSIIAGILLAIGFQILFTAIAIARGIASPGQNPTQTQSHSIALFKGEIGSRIGYWTLASVSVALFFASFFAVRLSLSTVPVVGFTLGLVIWATFFTLMVYLELHSVTSFLGVLITTALDSLDGIVFELSHLPEFTNVAIGKDEVDQIKTDNDNDDAIRNKIAEVRRTTVSAAWWLFGTLLVSALFSAIGGLLAVL